MYTLGIAFRVVLLLLAGAEWTGAAPSFVCTPLTRSGGIRRGQRGADGRGRRRGARPRPPTQHYARHAFTSCRGLGLLLLRPWPPSWPCSWRAPRPWPCHPGLQDRVQGRGQGATGFKVSGGGGRAAVRYHVLRLVGCSQGTCAATRPGATMRASGGERAATAGVQSCSCCRHAWGRYGTHAVQGRPLSTLLGDAPSNLNPLKIHSYTYTTKHLRLAHAGQGSCPHIHEHPR